jgi:hypothetical protein
VEIIFFIVGLAFLGIGILIIASEAKDRRATEPVKARVIGFSHGRSNNPNLASFHSVAEYVGRDGRKYYVEGSVSSSDPLHAVGQQVTVLMNPRDPRRAVLRSGISYALGVALAIMGLAAIGVFWITFRIDIFSMVMAAVILAGLGMKVKGAWRKQPLSLEAWDAYKKTTLSARVFTEDTSEQISWADPLRVTSAVETHLKANRFVVPVLFLLGFGLLFVGFHFYQKTERFLQSADHAVGTVIDLSSRDSSDGNDTYSAVVEYQDGRGVNFKFIDSFSSSPPYYYAGQEVQVLYNREDPNQAQIDRGLVNYWLTALFGSMGSLFALMGLHSARKRRIGIQKT